MLEAKAKNQGHNAEKISKKKKKKVFAPKFRKFFGKFKRLQNFFRQLSGVLLDETNLVMTLAHFQQVKNSAVLEPRIGHFRGLAGFEAKAKDFKLRLLVFHLCLPTLFPLSYGSFATGIVQLAAKQFHNITELVPVHLYTGTQRRLFSEL